MARSDPLGRGNDAWYRQHRYRQQQLVLRRLLPSLRANDHADAGTGALRKHAHRVHIFAGQPVRAVDGAPLDAAHGSPVAQPFPGGAHQGHTPGALVARVHNRQRGRAGQAVDRCPLPQRRTLTAHRLRRGLPVGRDARVQRGLDSWCGRRDGWAGGARRYRGERHGRTSASCSCRSRPTISGASVPGAGQRGDRGSRRHTTGTRRIEASASQAFARWLGSNRVWTLPHGAEWEFGRCALHPAAIPPLAGSWQAPLPCGEVLLMPLIVPARGAWDLQGPFSLARPLCHMGCRGELATMRKQGRGMLEALSAVFLGNPLPIAWGS